MYASTSMVIFIRGHAAQRFPPPLKSQCARKTLLASFRRLGRWVSHNQDSSERTFGLSKAEGAFLYSLVNSRHKPSPARLAGSPQSTPGWKLTDEERGALGLPRGQDALIHSRFPGVDSPQDFGRFAARIREQVDGMPVGIKIAAGHALEADLQVALAAGVDFVTVDGAQASSHAAQPILLDDFGIPSVIALCRAARVLKGTGVSLIVSGGFMTPCEMLKALALGADAVAVGAAPIMAAVHAQWQKIAPFEPPTQLIWHDGKHREKFDSEEGARDVANWFKTVAAVTGVPLAWQGPYVPIERPVPAQPDWHPETPPPPVR